MKKIYKSLFYLVLFFLLQTNLGLGQNNINLIEDPGKAKKITDVVPDGKALLVFEANEDFSFESSMENLIQPQKEGTLYKLLVNTGSVVISIKWGPSVTRYLNFGQLNENSDPPLRSKNIKYYKLKLSNVLEWGDQTMKMSKEVINTQATFEKEALIIINVYPDDLAVTFECDEGINPSKIDSEGGKYKVYILPKTKSLSIKAANYDPAVITFDSLQVKAVRYYFVQVPPTAKESEQVDVNIKVGNFSIESTPPGATIQMIGNPPFNQQQNKTPFALQGFKEGTEIITLSLNKYEDVTDTITISKKKGKKAVYKLIPKFAFISCNIIPSFPVSELFVDGSKVNSIVNDSLIELPKGTRKLEIRAPHFYPVTRIVNLAAGETSEINIKLSPIMGTFSISPGTYAENADVYINDLKIGQLPITNFPLQEGDYKLVLKKKGFVMKKEEMTFQIQENTLNQIKNVEMVNLKEITIESSPSGATVFIDNKTVGTTPLDIKVGIGEHSLSLEHENYDVLVRKFEVTPENSSFSYTLNPRSYNLVLKLKKPYNMPTLNVLVDNNSIGTIEKDPLTVNLKTKTYLVTFQNPKKNNKTVYKIKVRHPSKINERTICIPSKTGWSLLTTNIVMPLNSEKEFQGNLNPKFVFGILQFSFFGITLDLLQIQTIKSSNFFKAEQTMVSYLNPEFRLGGNIASWADISGFINGYYKNSVAKLEKDVQNTKVNMTGFSYGIALTMYARTSMLFSFTLKAGFKDDTITYENWDGTNSLPSQSFHENNSFVSVGINILTSGLDGKILRLWKRPLSQIGAY